MLDLILGILLLASAIASLHTENLIKSGIFFVVFGFISGLFWVRLEAPDIALVEIILGSAITGAIIFKLARGIKVGSVKVPKIRKIWAAFVVFLFFLFMLPYLFTIEEGDRLGSFVLENLNKAGVDSPVNAVLLNFRGYDTLLEVGVITLAVIGILTIQAKKEEYFWENPILKALGRRLLPLVVFFSLYITYLGTFSVGGAFQGGALLAGGLVLLTMSNQSLPISKSLLFYLSLLGLIVFAGIGLVYAYVGYGFLTYPLKLSTLSTITIELSLWISTALLLYTAYRGRL